MNPRRRRRAHEETEEKLMDKPIRTGEEREALGHGPGASAAPGAPGPDTAGVIAPPPLIYLGAVAISFGLEAVVAAPSLPSAVARPVGIVLIVAGVGLMGALVRAFGRARTPLDPYAPSEALVTDGPNRLSRNPLYLGATLTYAGFAILSNSLVALVPLLIAIAVIDRGVIVREECYLEQRFGVAYTDYKRRVRRWL
jgi:protein-S-isoprenylcysteine O-methyltransferase Ste14